MNLFSRTPRSAIGLCVDGMSLKAAHLRREGDRIVLAGLEVAQLKTRLEVGAEAGQAGAEPSAEDVLGLAPSPAAAAAPAETGSGQAEEEETNGTVLYGLLGKFPVAASTLAIGLMDASVSVFDLKGVGEARGKALRRQVLEKVAAAKGGSPPPDDRVDFFRAGTGVVALVHEDPLDLLGLMDGLRPFFERLQIGLIDAGEVALMNLVRRRGPADDEVTAVVHVGEEFSRAIFMRGGEYLGQTQAINEGIRSPQVLNTLYSRILFEQDTSHLPEIDRIALAGDARTVDARTFFSTQFPEARVEDLEPEGLDQTPLAPDVRTRVPEFDIPIGLAWKVLEPRNPKFHGTNFLSRERKRLQNPLEIAWHGLLVLALIAGTLPVLGFRLLEQNRSIDSLKSIIRTKEGQVRENSAYITLVDSLQNQVAWYQRNLAITDTLAAGYRAWSPFFANLSGAARRVNSLWFTDLSLDRERIVLKGRSLYRDRIPALAGLLEGCVVRKITRSEIRGLEIYDFELEVRSFRSLAQDTLEVAPALGVSAPDRMDQEEASTGGDPSPIGGR